MNKKVQTDDRSRENSKMKAKKKKQNDKVTFIIIPRITSRPWNLSIKRKYILATVMLLGVLGLSSVLAAYTCFNNHEEMKNISKIKEENKQKENTIKLLGEEIKDIENAQQDIAKKQNEIRKLMGLNSDDAESPTPSRGGQGGEERNQNLDSESKILYQAQELKTSLAIQEKELDDLLARVNNETEYFRSIPNQWPTEGKISSPYGWRDSPFGRGQSFHNGIDIANYSETEVCAAGDGTVIFAGWERVYGKTIIIDHGSGFKSKYGHNSALLVKEGDTVEKGETIARMGNTGLSTGPHLHFTVMKWDKTQDPLIYLPHNTESTLDSEQNESNA